MLRSSGERLLPEHDPAPGGALLAADSWLVDDGRVRGYDLHWARFGGWCTELGVPAERVAEFRRTVTAALPRAGRWSPRVEAVEGHGEVALRLRLRPAQPLARCARVLIAPPGDPRRQPRWKGPDLPLLLDLRAGAVAAGADELLLRDGEGRLVEGALTSLLWWEDDALCTTPGDRTLPSVTRALLHGIAAEQGAKMRERSPLPAELGGSETWLANASHGICVVKRWAPDAIAAGEARRAPDWQAALDRTALHLDDAG